MHAIGPPAMVPAGFREPVVGPPACPGGASGCLGWGPAGLGGERHSIGRLPFCLLPSRAQEAVAPALRLSLPPTHRRSREWGGSGRRGPILKKPDQPPSVVKMRRLSSPSCLHCRLPRPPQVVGPRPIEVVMDLVYHTPPSQPVRPRGLSNTHALNWIRAAEIPFRKTPP